MMGVVYRKHEVSFPQALFQGRARQPSPPDIIIGIRIGLGSPSGAASGFS